MCIVAGSATWSRQAAAEAMKQVQLSANHVENFIKAHKELAPMYEKLEPAAGKPDPKAMANIEAAVKRYGFSGLNEYEDVANSIAVVMGGIDPKTKQYSDPVKAIKSEIAQIQGDKKMSAAERKKALQELNAELKEAQSVQHPGNIQLVIKYYARLEEVLPQEPPQQQPPPPPPGKKK
jgi:hypothetical protein